jgi:hypothetical protein
MPRYGSEDETKERAKGVEAYCEKLKAERAASESYERVWQDARDDHLFSLPGFTLERVMANK